MANKQQQADIKAAEEVTVKSGEPVPAQPAPLAVTGTLVEAGNVENGVKVRVTRPNGWFFGGALHAHGTVLEVPKISVDEAFVEKV